MTYLIKYETGGFFGEPAEYYSQESSINKCIEQFKSFLKEKNREFPEYYEVYALVHKHENFSEQETEL